MTTLYLHIGMPKTGTTFIQTFMGKNKKLLQSKGYCYPTPNVELEGISINRNAHFLIHEYYDEKGERLYEKEKEFVDNSLREIVELKKDFPNIVISCESIFRASKKKERFWEDLKKWADDNDIHLKVLIYLRRQDYFIQSFWAQMVKNNITTMTLQSYVSKAEAKNIELDYYAYLEHIAGVIGKENIITRVYEKSVPLVQDFLESIQLELTDEYRMPDREINVSLAGKYLEAKRFLNHLPEFGRKNSFIIPLLRQVIEEEGVKSIHFQGTHYFNAQEKKEFLEQYEESNAAVAREYLGRSDGKLFEDDSHLDEGEARRDFTAKELVIVCGKVIAMQQKTIEELQKKIGDRTIKNLLRGKGKRVVKRVKRKVLGIR